MSMLSTDNATTQGAALDVLVMGTLLVELIPEGAGQAVTDMTRLIPMPSGAAANVALALAALGPRVGILTRVGDDELGEWVTRRLRQAGVDTTAVEAVPGQLTPVSFASADLRGGKRFTFYRFPGRSDPMGTLSPTSLDRAILQRARLFDFTEAVIRPEQLRATAFQAARWCHEAGGQVVYAVNYRPQSWSLPRAAMVAAQRQALAQADLALMNEEEHDLIFGENPAPLPSAEGSALVVTAGRRGGWVLAEGRRQAFSPWPVPVQYDVGAGDSFHAGYVAAYLAGSPPAQAARFAAACAALKISRPASAPPPTRAEVETFIGQG